jgi:hypothetical protein
MSNVPTINEIDETSPSQNSETVVASTNVVDTDEIQESISTAATIEEIDNTRKPTISEIYKIVTDGLFESTTNWWDYAYKLSQAQINQDIISRLDKGEIGGGYSKGVDIITTTSSELPANTNVYSALKSDTLYPKKLVDENINGIYDFLNGITVGKPTTYTGGQWSVDNDGKTHLTTDYLYVRLKAIFETLQILNVDTIGGKLVISPAGSINIAYVDEVTVTIDDIEQKVYRCYFLGEQDGEEIDNKWKVGDQAQAKSFNVKKGTYHNTGNHYLWRLVVGIDSDTVTIDNKKYHYVDLSQLVFDTGSDAPCPGDVLNQLGYRGTDDAQRQSAIVLNAVDSFAPSITLYAGINDFTLLNKEYVDYGVNNGKAFFNVYGDMYVGERGTNPTTYIKYANGKINIKANLEIGSSIGDKDLNQYIKDNAGLDEAAVLNIVNNAQVVKDLQKQVDGAIETWFYEGEPKLTNLPASGWTDDTTKENHVGDLYYDQSTGYAYRFTKYNTTDNPYGWSKISDSDITKALEAAAAAQSTADHKMKVYYGDEQPTDYQAGDIWVNATLSGKFNNDIARATTSSSKFNANHWVLASRYSEALASLLAWSEEYETKFSNLTDEVKAQKDQSIIVWYYEYAPTVSNAPANDWNTNDLRSEHIGDIFYDIKNNHSYRWTGSDWAEIKDADFTTAMSAAKDAQDTADSKRRVFYSDTTPSEPYDEGDLWVKKVDNKTETWIYNGTAWVKTESKELSDFSTSVTNQLSGIQSQIDGKAETWYQNTDPSTNWSDTQKTNHIGDLWYNTTDGTTQYWNGTAWEQMDIPKDVFDTIDGKASIFVDSYTDAKVGKGAIANGYKKCDLWILPEDATVNSVQYYKGDLLTATEDCTTFNESHWTKKVRYVGQTELADNIKVVNEKINNISASTLPGLEDKFTEFTKDGILDSSEKARLTDALAQMQAEYDAMNDQISTITSSTYLTNSANKTKLIEYQKGLKTAWTTYSDLIKGMINGTSDIDKTNIATANTHYNSLVNRIKEVQQTLTLCQSDIYTSLGTDLTSYKYLKQALNKTTDVDGGLVLTSAIELRDTDDSITAGMNGIVDGDVTSIAAWYGGPMVDRDTLSDDDKDYTNGGTKFARSLFRHDGSGYLSNGAIWWGTNGVLHGDPNSFILQNTKFSSLFLYTRLFYLHQVNGSSYDSIDYITPTKTFSRLQILPHGGTEGFDNLPTGLFVGTTTSGGQVQIGNIVLTNDGDNILKITNIDGTKIANVCSSGGITAYGVSTSSTEGGGLQGTVIKYSDAITLDSESMSQVASAYSIASLSSRIDNISTELSGLNLSWDNITGKPSTYTPSAHTHVWKDITDAPSKISSFTNDAGYLTTTDASSTYLTKTDASSTYQAKGSYASASHNHDSVYSKLGHTHNYASSVKVGDTSYDCTDNVISIPAYPTSLPASDVYSWAKASSKPSYSWSEITDKPSSFTPSDHTHTFASLTSKPTTLSGYGITDGLRAVTQPTGSNVFVTAISTSGTNITYTKSYTKKSLTAVDTSGWTNASTDSLIIPDMSFIAHWNGAYSGTSSNLAYCSKGAFGSFAIKNSLAFSELTSKPTTLNGYGITDAYTKTQIDTTVSTLNSSISTVNSKLANYLPLAGGTMTGSITFSDSGTSYRGIQGTVGGNDGWRIMGSATASDAGFLEIATADNGNEPIYVRQYNYDDDESFKSIIHTLTLLDGSGNTSIPGTLNIGGIIVEYDSTNKALKVNGNLYATGGITAYGEGSGSSGGGGLNGTIIPYATAIASDVESETTKIATASSIYKLHARISDIESNGATSISVTGSGNAVTAVSKSGTAITFTKGSTFLTSHQSLSAYYTATQVDNKLSNYLPLSGGTETGVVYSSYKSTTWVNSLTNSAITLNDASGSYGGWICGPTKDGRIAISTYQASNNNLYFGYGERNRTTNSFAKEMYWDGANNILYAGTFKNSSGTEVSYSGHTHTKSSITDFPSSLKNPNSLSWSGYSSGSYDGSSAQSITIPNNTNQLTNGAGYITSSGSCNYATSAGNADTVDGKHNIDFMQILGAIGSTGNWNDYTTAGCFKVQNPSGNVPGNYNYGMGLVLRTQNSADGEQRVCQLYFSHTADYAMAVRTHNYSSSMSEGWTSWAFVPTTKGNIATATKLQTSRTIWGQSFDGSGNVSGNMTGVGTIYFSDSEAHIGYGGSYNDPWPGLAVNFKLGGTVAVTSLYANGNILASGGITAYSSSDARLKTNIHKLDCLGVIKSIGGTYEFDYLKDGKHSIGFIAQRVNNPLLADILGKDDDGYLKINYWSPKLISLAFGALTEVDDEVERLKARVRELESEVEYLKMK